MIALALGLEQLQLADQVRQLGLAVGPGVEVAHVGLDRLAEQAELVPFAVLVDLAHRPAGSAAAPRSAGVWRRTSSPAGPWPALRRAPPRPRRCSRSSRSAMQTLRRLSGVLPSPMPITSSPCSRIRLASEVKSLSELTSTKPSNRPVCRQVHRVDHQADVGGVLALGIGRLLVRDEAERMHLLRPGLEPGRGPVAIDPPQRRFAVGGDFLEDRLGIAGGDVVGVDQDGEQRAWFVSHEPELGPRRRARKAAPPGFDHVRSGRREGPAPRASLLVGRVAGLAGLRQRAHRGGQRLGAVDARAGLGGRLQSAGLGGEIVPVLPDRVLGLGLRIGVGPGLEQRRHHLRLLGDRGEGGLGGGGIEVHLALHHRGDLLHVGADKAHRLLARAHVGVHRGGKSGGGERAERERAHESGFSGEHREFPRLDLRLSRHVPALLRASIHNPARAVSELDLEAAVAGFAGLAEGAQRLVEREFVRRPGPGLGRLDHRRRPLGKLRVARPDRRRGLGFRVGLRRLEQHRHLRARRRDRLHASGDLGGIERHLAARHLGERLYLGSDRAHRVHPGHDHRVGHARHGQVRRWQGRSGRGRDRSVSSAILSVVSRRP